MNRRNFLKGTIGTLVGAAAAVVVSTEKKSCASKKRGVSKDDFCNLVAMTLRDAPPGVWRMVCDISPIEKGFSFVRFPGKSL